MYVKETWRAGRHGSQYGKPSKFVTMGRETGVNVHICLQRILFQDIYIYIYIYIYVSCCRHDNVTPLTESTLWWCLCVTVINSKF